MDLERLRQLAGIMEGTVSSSGILNESWDDDDEDPDVARAEREAKKRKIKLPDVKVDAEKDMTHVAGAKKSAEKEAADEAKEKKEAAERAAAKKKEEADSPKAEEDSKPTQKKESPTKEKAEHADKKPAPAVEKKETPAEEKKEEAAAEAKRRGKAPNADSKRQRLHAYLKANPGVKRAVAIKWAQEHLEMGQAYASQQIQAVKSQIAKECWIIRHPSVPSFILHENGMMNMYQWMSDTDLNLEPMVFATESEAQKVAKYLEEYKNQLSTIEHVNLDV
ncbi:MAG: hypothetical protein CTY12_03455 [Methylotenera sp.]|nr:MAG: hypothetical protein CTY12_03455 [Methylotenera sp.]